MTDFTDLLDEYLEMRDQYLRGGLSFEGETRFFEVKNEINKRMRGEL